MPPAFKQLQAILLRKPGGDAVMAQVLAAVPHHGLEAVLVSVELALEAGKPSGEHVLNVLARLKSQQPAAKEGDGQALTQDLNKQTILRKALQLRNEPQANLTRYEVLRSQRSSSGAAIAITEVSS